MAAPVRRTVKRLLQQEDVWLKLGWRHHHDAAGASLNYVPRRAVLYCPGNDERKLRKLATLDVDCAVLDCEDGVALTKKTEARENIARMLAELNLGRTEKCVRVNSVSSGLAEADLQVVLQAEVLPPALMLPKVEDNQEVQWFVDRFQRSLKGRPLTGPVRLVTFVETAVGLLNFKAVCEEIRRLAPEAGLHHDGVVFGSDDFCASIDFLTHRPSLSPLPVHPLASFRISSAPFHTLTRDPHAVRVYPKAPHGPRMPRSYCTPGRKWSPPPRLSGCRLSTWCTSTIKTWRG
ncbi:citramalyl-CoA lyase, mitochondrial isoform X3 [Vanacampus margaritifer]